MNPRFPRGLGGYRGWGLHAPGTIGGYNPPVTVLGGTYYPSTPVNPPVTVVTGNYPGTPGTIPPATVVNRYPPCPGWPRIPLPRRHWLHFHLYGMLYGDDGEVADDVTPIDVETIAIKFIDAGDASQGTGPAYRVTVRNNSDVAIDEVFDLTLAASDSQALPADVPAATTWIDGMQAGEVRDFDLRLPVSVDTMGPTVDGQPTPFSLLSAMADSQNRLVETDKVNNLMVMNRTEVPAATDE